MRSLMMSAALCLVPCVVTAQTNPAAQAGRKWRQAHERAIIDEFVSLLSIPNIARDRENIQRNAQAIARMLEKRSIPAKLVSVPGSNPIVFGEIRTPGATRTIVFYAHYDGQPLDPSEWSSPPFEPTLRDGPVESGGKDHFPGRCRIALQPGSAHVRPIGRGRQGADCRHRYCC